jgi:MFS family permease
MYLSDRPRLDKGPARGAGSSDTRGRVARTVVLLGVVSMLTDISSEATNSVLPVYLTLGLGLSPVAYGVVDGIYQGASVAVRLLGGWLADRADRPKPVALVGYGISAAARVVFLSVSSLAGITACLGVDRVGKGLRTAPRDALIAASSDPSRLGRSFGVHRALDTTGAVLGPCVAFVVLVTLPGDYTSVFVISCAAAFLGLAVLVLLVPDLRPSRLSAPSDRVARPSLRLLADRRLGGLLGAAGLLALLTISDGFLYLALQQREELALRWFPLLFVGTNVAYLALSIPFGLLADRVGRARVMVAAHVFLVGACLCVAGPVHGVAAVAGCLLLLGAFYAATDGVLAAATVALAPSGMGATAIATSQSVVAGTRLLASLGFGWLWLTLGVQQAVLVMMTALLLAIPVAWRLVRASAAHGAGR